MHEGHASNAHRARGKRVRCAASTVHAEYDENMHCTASTRCGWPGDMKNREQKYDITKTCEEKNKRVQEEYVKMIENDMRFKKKIYKYYGGII